LTLKQRLQGVTLIPSSGGVFEVVVDGRIIHSKKATGQFPKPDDILREVRTMA